jgi:cyanophycinase
MLSLSLSLWVACVRQDGPPDAPPSTDTTSPTSSPTSPGTPTVPTPPTARRLVAMLHGGGPEEDALFARFVADAGGGRFVTLGSNDPQDPYLRFWDEYFVSLGAEDAVTVNTASRDDAMDPAAAAAVDEADALFIRGGDQAAYLFEWTDTPLHDALRRAVARGVAIGGSSAGCAVLGERVFDARLASPGPWEALDDPFDGLTFTDGWLDVVPGVITDTHLTERGRMPRLAAFVARWWADGRTDALGVGVDPETALFVYDDGTAEVAGPGSVTVLRPPATATVAPGEPLDLRDMALWQLPAGYVVRLEPIGDPGDLVVARPDWVTPAAPVALPVAWPVVDLDGSDRSQRALGDWVIPEIDDPDYPWYYGRLTEAPGSGTLPGAFVLTQMYGESDDFEAHVGGMLWTLARHPGTVGIGVDLRHRVRTTDPPGIEVGRGWALVLDTRTATFAADPARSPQTVALEGATLHVVAEGRMYALGTGR